MNVALVAMPFYSTAAPAPGISLLKAGLARVGIECDLLYLNIAYARMFGRDACEQVCVHKSDGGETLLGEWIFAEECFPGLLPPVAEYRRYLGEACPGAARYYSEFLDLRNSAGKFIQWCLESVPWEKYDLIGFTATFDQTVSSLLLARLLKSRFPGKFIILGGANCDGPMGIELHRRFPFLDFVCSGEADISFPELATAIRDRRPVPAIGGIVMRRDGESLMSFHPEPVQNLDALPFPDYSDYYVQFERAFGTPAACVLPIETSRGCWWGARSQCRFCGLNPQNIAFRTKSPSRVVEELWFLTQTCRPAAVAMTDNILGMDSFRELLPALGARQLPAGIFYEVKANLNSSQVRSLADAGIRWVQPGIESLNDHSLQLMAKGVSALQNVQVLRFCLEHGVQPIWNFLSGVPGETQTDYEKTIALIRSVTHLPPPDGSSAFCLHRFSPWFREPERYGLRNVRPKPSYRFVYPFSGSELAGLAYYFDFDYDPDVTPPDGRPLEEALRHWRECSDRGAFLRSVASSSTSLLIEDGREKGGALRYLLQYGQKDLYEFCDQVRGLSEILRHSRELYGGAVAGSAVQEWLDAMVSLRLMARDDNRYLSLAVALNGASGRSV